jgi:predicted GNAT family acetyltransferase
VAAACAKIFQRGKDFCVLHADLDNPMSTGMYKLLGFQLRATTEDITFVPLSSDDAPSS